MLGMISLVDLQLNTEEKPQESIPAFQVLSMSLILFLSLFRHQKAALCAVLYQIIRYFSLKRRVLYRALPLLKAALSFSEAAVSAFYRKYAGFPAFLKVIMGTFVT